MANASSINPIPVGLDDGYAFTKIALPDGRLLAIPSRARVGQSGVTWIHEAEQRISEYETEDTVYSVGALDGAPTHFEGYPWSGLNRAVVQHALQQAGLAGKSVHAVSGLPVSTFYRKSGEHRQETIARKRDSLKQAVRPLSGALPAGIAFHEVIPEALAAWYDYVIVELEGGVTLDADRVSVPVAIVDIGGRTTDYVVVKDQGILHSSSGSLQCGMLNVKQSVADGIQERFDLETLSEQLV
ncbi:MAG: ParM/StbA family protein, partial [Candidatus Thiodiazotropha taylori]|nr:ParM/StbA family protein [Candidatus Thiodiazotropha taylori]MCW4333838.1 ParM/StbA family protein [Candidatus Thiodiazotropha endolucinida]